MVVSPGRSTGPDPERRVPGHGGRAGGHRRGEVLRHAHPGLRKYRTQTLLLQQLATDSAVPSVLKRVSLTPCYVKSNYFLICFQGRLKGKRVEGIAYEDFSKMP